VRDTIENYIASIMLSLRQPFRPNDHVVIDNKEGRVIRLTSRATILMTLDGNHLRIPNASVFKAVILNYTRNPERRFDFELGVDADDDPIAAIETGVGAIRALDFVLKDPPPLGFIKAVGDSNIVIFFAAWIDQRRADFAKSRSLALSAAKDALEDAGFALPEPIYRLRFDEKAPPILKETTAATVTTGEAGAEKQKKRERAAAAAAQDVAPDTHLEEKVEEERREEPQGDLLSPDAPVE
jgi:small-conductance mechanosensitive channel